MCIIGGRFPEKPLGSSFLLIYYPLGNSHSTCTMTYMLFYPSPFGKWEKKTRGSCVLGGPFEGYMGMKPIETGIWVLSINDQNIIFFCALNTVWISYSKIALLFSLSAATGLQNCPCNKHSNLNWKEPDQRKHDMRYVVLCLVGFTLGVWLIILVVDGRINVSTKIW